MAPRLNRRLVLESPQSLADGAGGFTESWAALGTLWAQVESRSGRETSGAAMAVSRVRYRVTLRAAPSGAPSRPVAGQRFREGDRVLRILAVTEDDADGRYLVADAEEEVIA
ncbi:head-tail adaptor protein [Salibaculum sp.]|uniref:head-tail adaptor protein n=1 Tax=Salibaculum sp. TaxID=2855480 RepID=UPI002B490441|nr:head-tail adaptor protein [Salibaculum sp.]HKL68325.1 head-tail adaptor protein [Salibaculum sp.]